MSIFQSVWAEIDVRFLTLRDKIAGNSASQPVVVAGHFCCKERSPVSSSLAVPGKYCRDAIANCIRCLWLLIVLFPASLSFAATVHIRTIDSSNKPVANVQVTIQAQGKTLRTAITNS